MNKKSITKTLKYILLEIVLVVAGILIAVRINLSIENSKNNEIRCEFLTELDNALDGDIKDATENWNGLKDWNPKMRAIIKGHWDKNLDQVDSLPQKFGTVGNYVHFFQSSKSKIEEIKYSPINLIDNRALKNKVFDYQNAKVNFLLDREKLYDKIGDDIRNYYTKNFIGYNYQPAYPNDFEKLSTNTEYFSLVRQRYELSSHLAQLYDSLIKTQRELKREVQEEIKRKKCSSFN